LLSLEPLDNFYLVNRHHDFARRTSRNLERCSSGILEMQWIFHG
jgi:hypothetical protein